MNPVLHAAPLRRKTAAEDSPQQPSPEIDGGYIVQHAGVPEVLSGTKRKERERLFAASFWYNIDGVGCAWVTVVAVKNKFSKDKQVGVEKLSLFPRLYGGNLSEMFWASGKSAAAERKNCQNHFHVVVGFKMSRPCECFQLVSEMSSALCHHLRVSRMQRNSCPKKSAKN